MKLSKRSYVMTARAAKAEATRTRILASAMQLYTERAIEDFILDEVAEHSATTVQTVLRIFGNKDKLIFATLGGTGGRAACRLSRRRRAT